jgi:hypothetical protein
MDFDAATSADFSTDCAVLFYLQHAYFCALVEPLPRQTHDDRLQLLVRERHATIMSETRADEAPFIELSRAQPEAKAIVNQHLHAVGAFVDEEVGVMRTRFAKNIHDAGQRLVNPGTHVERLYREPGNIDPYHRMSSRSSNAHSCAADAGHSTITVPPRRRTLMRIAASVAFDGSGTGTKFWPPSIARLDAEPRIAIGIPLRSASLTHRRNTLALRPRAKAMAAMDTPGCWHSPTASALKSGLWLRRRRRPMPTTCSVVRTCTPIALNKRASLHHFRRAKRCLSRTLTPKEQAAEPKLAGSSLIVGSQNLYGVPDLHSGLIQKWQAQIAAGQLIPDPQPGSNLQDFGKLRAQLSTRFEPELESLRGMYNYADRQRRREVFVGGRPRFAR